MADYGSQEVKCPFYIKENENQIYCEGIITKKCIQHFINAKKKRQHKSKCCNSDYRQCRHFKTVEQMYE